MAINPNYLTGSSAAGDTTTARYEEPYASAMRRGFLESAFGLLEHLHQFLLNK